MGCEGSSRSIPYVGLYRVLKSIELYRGCIGIMEKKKYNRV